MHSWKGSGFAAVLWLAATPTVGDAIDVRQLPTPVEIWRWSGVKQSLLAGEELIFVAGKGRVSAIDPRDGELAWSTAIGTEAEDCGCGHGALVHVDDRLFVPIADAVAVVDTDDGVLVYRTPPLGGTVHNVLGPPVVVKADGESGTTLVRLDERSGIELRRFDAGSKVWELERFGARYTVFLDRPREPPPAAVGEEGALPAAVSSESTRLMVMGLDENLEVDWQRELGTWARVEREGEALKLVEYDPQGGTEKRYPIDPETGALGALAPADERGANREGQGDTDVPLVCDAGPFAKGGETIELRRAEEFLDDAHPAKLRRGGAAPWAAELPGRPEDCVRWGERRLLVRLQRSTTRDLLAVVDAKDGDLERLLYLPPGVSAILPVAPYLVLEERNGLVAIDPLVEAPSEAETKSVAEAVAEILARAGRGRAKAIAAELSELGSEAVPLAVAALARLEGDALLAVAMLAAEAGYTPAAAPLADALVRTAAASSAKESERDNDYQTASLVEALAALASPAQVPVLARYARRGERACAPALAALGRIATPEALAAVDGALAATSPADGPWFEPPEAPRSPLSRSRLKELKHDPAAMREAGGREAVERAAGSAEVAVDGGALLVFRANAAGHWGDTWVAERPAPPGATESSVALAGGIFYLGALGHCPQLAASVVRGALRLECAPQDPTALAATHEAALLARLEAELEEHGGPSLQHPLQMALGAWRRDSDGDGLTDLLETRLHLDPHRADTDGDGVADRFDRAPNARKPEPWEGADEALLVAALEFVWACAPERAKPSVPLFVEADLAAEWRGRSGPTITLGAGERAGAGAAEPAWALRIEVADGAPPLAGNEDQPPPGPGEHRVDILYGAPGQSVERSGSSLYLRRAGTRWVVTRQVHSWESRRE